MRGIFSIFMTCAWQIAEALRQYNRVQPKNVVYLARHQKYKAKSIRHDKEKILMM
jgi:hypothetical protein